MSGAEVRGALVAVLLMGTCWGQGAPPLPKWSPDDYEQLQNGELVPGEKFFRQLEEAELGELLTPTVAEPDLVPPPLVGPPTPPAEEEFPTVISTKYLNGFFGGRPELYLVDPQELLSRQEFRDRESFLKYHAGESAVDLYVYLFDAKQELPIDVTIESVFQEHFTGSGPTALVFYFLGMPERSQLCLSEEIRAIASVEEQERALRTSVQEAFEKSDPADQLDSFSVELSIRLYWFEKAMAGIEGNALAEAPAGTAGDERDAGSSSSRQEELQVLVRNTLAAVTVLILAGALGWLGRRIADRRSRHLFPEIETGPLLGAPHAAGIGAVISFSSSQLPPAQQRDQVPDYLQRM